tara:strand:- start:6245 stop:6991 length:747 start_codon:yes stop_codon:yes gene_type:complete
MSRANDTSTDPAGIRWESRRAKRHADEIAFNAIKRWAVPRKYTEILSFPAADWGWESYYAQVFPEGSLDFYGLEQDHRIHPEMVKRAEVRPTGLHKRHALEPITRPCSFKDYARGYDAEALGAFDMIYLDWMGTWSADKEEQVRLMFNQGMLGSDSIFRFTVSLLRGKPAKWEEACADYEHRGYHIADIRGGGCEVPEWRTHGVPALVEHLGSLAGYQVRTIAAQLYYTYGKTHTTPQGSFMFRVKKK